MGMNINLVCFTAFVGQSSSWDCDIGVCTPFNLYRPPYSTARQQPYGECPRTAPAPSSTASGLAFAPSQRVQRGLNRQDCRVKATKRWSWHWLLVLMFPNSCDRRPVCIYITYICMFIDMIFDCSFFMGRDGVSWFYLNICRWRMQHLWPTCPFCGAECI